jgi:hypothetical protein
MNSSGDLAVVTVLVGQATVYATLESRTCFPFLQVFTPVSTRVLDSPQAASIADSWGGSAFLANYSGASAIYSITGALTISPAGGMGGPVGGGGTQWGNSSAGNGTPPPTPIPPPVNLSLPAVWTVSYSTCTWLVACPGQGAGFIVAMVADNGSVLSVNGYLGGSGGFGYPVPGFGVLPPLQRVP